MPSRLQTVVETPSYPRFAERHLSDDERSAIVDLLANAPESGVLIQGSGGVRKLRVPAKGQGKSGGARVIHFYHDATMPLFLLFGYAKNVRKTLSRSEVNDLAKIVRRLADTHRSEQ
jgi:hypothetical protein